MERVRVDLVEDDRLATLQGRLAKKVCSLGEADLVLLEAWVDEMLARPERAEISTSRSATP